MTYLAQRIVEQAATVGLTIDTEMAELLAEEARRISPGLPFTVSKVGEDLYRITVLTQSDE